MCRLTVKFLRAIPNNATKKTTQEQNSMSNDNLAIHGYQYGVPVQGIWGRYVNIKCRDKVTKSNQILFGWAVAIPGSNATSQDALDGAAVEPFEDLRTHAMTTIICTILCSSITFIRITFKQLIGQLSHKPICWFSKNKCPNKCYNFGHEYGSNWEMVNNTDLNGLTSLLLCQCHQYKTTNRVPQTTKYSNDMSQMTL